MTRWLIWAIRLWERETEGESVSVVQLPKFWLPYPGTQRGNVNDNGYDAQILTPTGSFRGIAMAFQAPKDGTLDTFEWRTAVTVSLNASSVIRCSFQDPSTSAIGPDGTQDQYRDIDSTIITGSRVWIAPGLITSDGTDSGTKRTVSKGDVVWCVIQYQTGNTGDQVEVHVGTAKSQMMEASTCWPCILYTNGTSWSQSSDLWPFIAVKYNDGTYAQQVCNLYVPYDTVSALDFSSSSSPDERGTLFQVPVAWEIDGLWMRGGVRNSAAQDFDLVLYDSSSSVVRSVSYDATQGDLDTYPLGVFLPLSSKYVFTPNSNYRLVLKPTTTTAVRIWEETFASEAIKNTVYGSTWKHTQRTDAGSWTDDASAITLGLGFQVSGIDVT